MAALRVRRQSFIHKIFRVLTPALMVLGLATGMVAKAQTFRNIAGLNFTKIDEGANPLPQVVTVASTGAAFDYSVAVSTSSGGNWLTLSQASGCCYSTPNNIIVTAAPAVTLAAGTYNGQIVLKSSSGSVSLTIPVSLSVKASGTAFFDDVPGALTYSMQTSGSAPPSQTMQIRNAGMGTLAWTASATTSDGGGWLTLSAASGTAPSYLTATITPSKLPGAGLTAGTFVGQIALSTSGDTVTVPVAVTVGSSVVEQVNPINFVKEYEGGNPLSQVINFAGSSTQTSYSINEQDSTGGSWLKLSSANGCCYATPSAVTLNVNPSVTLAAGTYMAQIVALTSNGAQAMVVPVTMVVAPTSVSSFDSLPGQLAFSMLTHGDTPPAQVVQIRDAGAGSLGWTVTNSTADGGAWLSTSAGSGTAPSDLSVAINPAKLPGAGLVAGTFTGQLVLSSSTDRVTIPVAVTVGAQVLQQVNALNFTKLYEGANPLPQTITFSSTGSNFDYSLAIVNGTGGNWLTLDEATGCCYATPGALSVGVNPAVTLASGTYTAEVVAVSSTGGQSVTVPVTLTVLPASSAFFDVLPGQLSFSMATSGAAPPAQSFEIRNAGGGTLSWSASADTADGGGWLTLSSSSGTAPGYLSAGVTPSKLPGQGLVAGTFSGEVILENANGRVTIPVTVTVGASVFRQISPLNFSMGYEGAKPLPQVISVASTGSNFDFSIAVENGTGGNWLTINRNTGCCLATPSAITASVAPSPTLAAGTYTAEILFKTSSGNQAMAVPVTLTVAAGGTAYFDALPGAVTFSMGTTGANPAAQSFVIRNGGSGTLPWTATSSTSDGGSWLTLSATTGSAPSTVFIGVVTANLPGKGLSAGNFTGEITLQSGTLRATVPVIVTVGTPVFSQPAALTFNKNYQGSNPASQIAEIASSGSAFSYSIAPYVAAGGSWFSLSEATGCCYSTPQAVTVSASPASTLAGGVYLGEIIATSSSGSEATVIPVTLNVNSSTATATPTFTPPAGTYSSAQTVTIADTSEDAAIYYTLDGSTPTTSSSRYTGPLAVTSTQTIKAIAVAPGYAQSTLATAVYTLTGPTAALPIPTQTVTIAEATAGATVYYTTNGATPTTTSTKYTGPITFTASTVLKFIAVAPGYSASAVRTVTVTVQ